MRGKGLDGLMSVPLEPRYAFLLVIQDSEVVGHVGHHQTYPGEPIKQAWWRRVQPHLYTAYKRGLTE